MWAFSHYIDLSFDSLLVCFAWTLPRQNRALKWHMAIAFAAFDAIATLAGPHGVCGVLGYALFSGLLFAVSQSDRTRLRLLALAALMGLDNLLLHVPVDPLRAGLGSFAASVIGLSLASFALRVVPARIRAALSGALSRLALAAFSVL